MRISNLLREISREEFEKFQDLKGSYNLQGHVDRRKDLELRNMEPEAVPPESTHPQAVSELRTPYGLWTSTVYKLDTFTTKWKETPWVRPRDNYLHVFTIVNNPDIRHVNSKEDAGKVAQRFEKDGKIDWETIAKRFDAFHVWGGALETNIFGYWDVESTVWFRPKDYLKKQFTWKLDFGPINQLWKDIGDSYD